MAVGRLGTVFLPAAKMLLIARRRSAGLLKYGAAAA